MVLVKLGLGLGTCPQDLILSAGRGDGMLPSFGPKLTKAEAGKSLISKPDWST